MVSAMANLAFIIRLQRGRAWQQRRQIWIEGLKQLDILNIYDMMAKESEKNKYGLQFKGSTKAIWCNRKEQQINHDGHSR